MLQQAAFNMVGQEPKTGARWYVHKEYGNVAVRIAPSSIRLFGDHAAYRELSTEASTPGGKIMPVDDVRAVQVETSGSGTRSLVVFTKGGEGNSAAREEVDESGRVGLMSTVGASTLQQARPLDVQMRNTGFIRVSDRLWFHPEFNTVIAQIPSRRCGVLSRFRLLLRPKYFPGGVSETEGYDPSSWQLTQVRPCRATGRERFGGGPAPYNEQPHCITFSDGVLSAEIHPAGFFSDGGIEIKDLAEVPFAYLSGGSDLGALRNGIELPSGTEAAVMARTEINGISVTELEERMAPNTYTSSGMLRNEGLNERLRADYQIVSSLNLSYFELLAPLLKIRMFASKYPRQGFTYAGKRYSVSRSNFAGGLIETGPIDGGGSFAYSPFDSKVRTSNGDYYVTEEETGRSFLFSVIGLDMGLKFGFFQSPGLPYRLDPSSLHSFFKHYYERINEFRDYH